MATHGRLSRFLPPLIPIATDNTLASPGPARIKVASIVIATRNEIVAAGIAALVQADGHSVAARCANEDDLLRRSEACRPDIIVLAESVVGQNPATLISRLHAYHHAAAIVLLLEERDTIKPAHLLELDVRGILLNAVCARTFLDCIESVRNGRTWVDPHLFHYLAMAQRSAPRTGNLTSREADVARLVSQGLPNKEIARELRLTEGTVKMYLHRIYEKLQLSGRMQLALSMAGACAPMPHANNGGPARNPARPASDAATSALASGLQRAN